MERDSFVFYKSFYEAIKNLPTKNKVKIYQAIIEFALTGSEPTYLKGIEISIFLLIKPQILANNKKYENGCKGGRPPKNEKSIDNYKENLTKVKPKQNQTITKLKPNDNVNVNVNDNDNENDNVNGNGNEKGKGKGKQNGESPIPPSSFSKKDKTTNDKQQTTNDIPKGYQELVDYLMQNYNCPEDNAKLIANRVQSDKVDLSFAHCEEFTAMTKDQIISYFEAMKKLKQLRNRSKMVNAASVFNRT